MTAPQMKPYTERDRPPAPARGTNVPSDDGVIDAEVIDVAGEWVSGAASVVIDGVRVRYRKASQEPPTWRCDEHGQIEAPTCSHALEAAAALAEHVFGVKATTYPVSSDR